MQYRKLGKTGVQISAISIGAMTYGPQIGTAASVDLIKNALAAGINSFDTADEYPGSEEILGTSLKGQRDEAFIATKVGLPLGNSIFHQGLTRKHIMQGVEVSLKRLQTDYIDLYYCHIPDYNVPIEDTLSTLNDLLRQGKVRYIGCSNFTAWQLAKALGISERYNLARFECIETPYNLLTRDIEFELLGLCDSEKVGITAYNPLAGEMLTGRHQFGEPPAKGRFTLEGFAKGYLERYWSETNFKAVDRFKELANSHGCTLPQLAIAWTLNCPTVTSVLSGLITVDQLKENIAAVEIKLSPEELQVCDEVWAMFRPPRFFYALDGRFRKTLGKK
jgi:1-deoxyxylulose-5-phosphate synthase